MEQINDKHINVNTDNVADVSDLTLLKQLISELIKNNEITALRKLLRINKNCIQFKTKDLNEELYKDGYKFVKRNGIMTYIQVKQKPKYGKSIEKCQSILNNINNN